MQNTQLRREMGELQKQHVWTLRLMLGFILVVQHACTTKSQAHLHIFTTQKECELKWKVL